MHWNSDSWKVVHYISLLDHNYSARPYLTGHHGLVTALLVTLVPAVEVSVTDALAGDPEAARGVLRGAGRPTLVVCLVLLSVI